VIALIIGWLLLARCPLTWAEEPRTKADVLAELSGYKQHALWTECRTVGMLVAYTPAGNSSPPYPTRESIDTIIRSRLRAARLYEESRWKVSGLSIYIRSMKDEPDDILNALALISFGFHKEMHDPWTETYRYVPVWSRESWAGVSRLHETVSELMDEFIDEYLRVNEPACREKAK